MKDYGEVWILFLDHNELINGKNSWKWRECIRWRLISKVDGLDFPSIKQQVRDETKKLKKKLQEWSQSQCRKEEGVED